MSRYQLLILQIALQILRAALPGLKRRAAASPTPADDVIITLIEHLVELAGTGELTALLQPPPP
jgi:hypothetical protein